MYYLCNYDISPKLGQSLLEIKLGQTWSKSTQAKSTRNENKIYVQRDTFLYKISYTIMKHLYEAGNYKHCSEFSIQPLVVEVSVFENGHKKQIQNIPAF